MKSRSLAGQRGEPGASRNDPAVCHSAWKRSPIGKEERAEFCASSTAIAQLRVQSDQLPDFSFLYRGTAGGSG